MKWLKEFWKKLTAPAEVPRVVMPPSAMKPGARIMTRQAGQDYSNFTPHAQQVLALARKEADRFNHNFVGTEHVLLGLVALGQGPALNVLAKSGINLETLRSEVEKQIGKGPGQRMVGNIPYTPRVKKVLALAAREAKALNHPYVDTGHILLGILRDGDGAAVRVLKNLDLNFEQARAELLEELPSQPVADSASRASEPASSGGEAIWARERADQSVSNFTPRAEQALKFASEEANRFHHNYVGPEHLLLGLIRLGQGVMVNVLARAGLDLETCRTQIEKQNGTGPEGPPRSDLPYNPRMRKVLAQAVKEASSISHTYVGTEHMLLGILHDGEGVTAQIFKNLAIDPATMRQDILTELRPSEPASSGGVAVQPRGTPEFSFSNFTPRAHQVLALAQKETARFNHNFVGTEHLMLGIVKLGQGTAVNVLQKLGIDLELLRAEVVKQVGTGPDQKMIGTIPYTPRARKVLALAAKEADALNHTYVGTEHLLLGLLREGDGVAARVLRNLGLEVEKTRQEVLKELDPNYQLQSTGGESSPTQPTPAKPMTTPSPLEPVDTSKRYDVYCLERSNNIVVYRNALFKGSRFLFPKPGSSAASDFVELEQSNGQTIFISKISIRYFCLPGVKPEGEKV